LPFSSIPVGKALQFCTLALVSCEHLCFLHVKSLLQLIEISF
jgi:hypothetical protein